MGHALPYVIWPIAFRAAHHVSHHFRILLRIQVPREHHLKLLKVCVVAFAMYSQRRTKRMTTDLIECARSCKSVSGSSCEGAERLVNDRDCQSSPDPSRLSCYISSSLQGTPVQRRKLRILSASLISES